MTSVKPKSAAEARKAAQDAKEKIDKAAADRKEKQRLASIAKAEKDREDYIRNTKASFEFDINEAIKDGKTSCTVNVQWNKEQISIKDFKANFYYYDELEKIRKSYAKLGYTTTYKEYSVTNYVYYNYESGDGGYETTYYIAIELEW